MLTCKQVSRALAEHDYRRLPFWSRLSLRMHVALCVVCGRYNRQVMWFQDGVRGLRRQVEEDDAAPLAGEMRLPPEARERLRACLHDSGALKE